MHHVPVFATKVPRMQGCVVHYWLSQAKAKTIRGALPGNRALHFQCSICCPNAYATPKRGVTNTTSHYHHNRQILHLPPYCSLLHAKTVINISTHFVLISTSRTTIRTPKGLGDCPSTKASLTPPCAAKLWLYKAKADRSSYVLVRPTLGILLVVRYFNNGCLTALIT